MAHYFDEKPQLKHQLKDINFQIKQQNFYFKTDQGVFSRSQVDFGTKAMLEVILNKYQDLNGDFLDLGCGYGVVGIVMKRFFPRLMVAQSDINERALDLTRLNAKQNQVKIQKIMKSDGLETIGGAYDLIMTNPPVRAGKSIVQQFFSESYQHLNHQGRLIVVLQKKQGASSALKKLESLFLPAGSCEVIAKKSGYWIISCQKITV